MDYFQLPEDVDAHVKRFLEMQILFLQWTDISSNYLDLENID